MRKKFKKSKYLFNSYAVIEEIFFTKLIIAKLISN